MDAMGQKMADEKPIPSGVGSHPITWLGIGSAPPDSGMRETSAASEARLQTPLSRRRPHIRSDTALKYFRL